MADSPPQRTRAFVSYSHADADYLTRLRIHLAPYTREHKVDVWDDTRITPGALWKEAITRAIAEAKVAILLVSADFMASEFIAHDELPPLLEAAEQEGLLIFQVFLSPCAFTRSKLARYQLFNNLSEPLKSMLPWQQDAIWAKLAEAVADALAPAPSNITLQLPISVSTIVRERDEQALKPTPGPKKRTPVLKNMLKRLAGMVQLFLKPALLSINSLLLSIPLKKGASPAGPNGKIPRRALLLGGGLVLVGGLGVAGDLVWQAIQYRFLSIGTLIYTYRRHQVTVRAVAWSPDSNRIASGSRDESVQVWNASNGDLQITAHHTSDVETVAWSPNGSSIASGSDDTTARVWDASNGNQISILLHVGTVEAVAWSPDSKRIASGSDDTTVVVEGASTGVVNYTYYQHSNVVRAVAWSPNGLYLASGGDDTSVRVWEPDGTAISIYSGHYAPVRAVAWSPDSTRIASGSGAAFGDNIVHVWNATDGTFLFNYNGHSDIIEAVAWSPDGTRIASGGHDNTVQVWGASNGRHLFTYTGHTHWVYSVAWSPDGTRIASAGADNTVQVWAAG